MWEDPRFKHIRRPEDIRMYVQNKLNLRWGIEVIRNNSCWKQNKLKYSGKKSLFSCLEPERGPSVHFLSVINHRLQLTEMCYNDLHVLL